MDYPIIEKVEGLRPSDKIRFGIWCVYELSKRTDLSAKIEEHSENPELFSKFRSYMRDVWRDVDQNELEVNTGIGSILLGKFSAIVWDIEASNLVTEEDEHQFKLAGFLIDAAEYLLRFIVNGEIEDLIICAESVYNFSDYETSFGLCKSGGSPTSERQAQLDFVKTLELTQVSHSDIERLPARWGLLPKE